MYSNNTGLSIWIKSQLKENTLIKNDAAGLTDREIFMKDGWL